MAPQNIQRPAVNRERGKDNRGLGREESVAGAPEARHGPRKPQKLSGIQNMLERSARPERAAHVPPLMPGRAGRRGST